MEMMTTLYNEIIINAPIEKIWEALSDIENLDKFDPTVKISTALTPKRNGIGAKRKVEMKDGKNWFEDIVVEFQPNQALTYQLINCSFPVKGLRHSYSFEKKEAYVKVKQVIQYRIKFGFLGKILDTLMIRRQTEKGIRKFFEGLKSYAERN
jgi:ribosome-associated toxin RatA of RatAB toxin-antitoxin module